MFTSLSSKRRSEQATNEPRAKRPRREHNPESLQTQLKSLSRQLLDRLAELLDHLPDHDATKTDREYIEIMQRKCQGILGGWRLSRELAAVFETNRKTDFLLAHFDQFTFSTVEARFAVIDGASNVREIILKCIEERDKQYMDASEQEIEYIHQTHPGPSAAAKNSALRSNQTPDNLQAVYNGRPTALTGPCLSVYHPIFQTFMQEYNSPVDPGRISLLDYKLANHIVCSSVEYFNNEVDRFNAIGPALQHFLSPGFIYYGSMLSDERYWTPSGHAPVKCGIYNPGELGYRWMVKCIKEMKNGLGIGNADPVEQGQQDYVLVCTSSNASRLRRKSCMPTFLLGIAGPHLSIAGAIFLGRAVSSTLVGYNNLTQVMPSAQIDRKFVNSHDRLVWHTAHTLRALGKCMGLLDDYYENMQPGNVPSDVLHPAPHFEEFQSEKGRFQLIYRSHLLGDQLSARSVFLADAVPESDSNSRIKCVVKFTERYGKEGHELMAAAQVAAELLYCEWEATVGLWVVVTRYYEYKAKAMPTQEGITRLRKGLEALHREGFVHGDIREANILVDSNGDARLIDFDWSERVGVARYPSLLNHDLGWVSGVDEGHLVTPEHDNGMFGSYLSKLEKRKLEEGRVQV